MDDHKDTGSGDGLISSQVITIGDGENKYMLDVTLIFKERINSKWEGDGFECYVPGLFTDSDNTPIKGIGQTLEEAELDYYDKQKGYETLSELKMREEEYTDKDMGIEVENIEMDGKIKITRRKMEIGLNFKREVYISKGTQKRIDENKELKLYFHNFIYNKI